MAKRSESEAGLLAEIGDLRARLHGAEKALRGLSGATPDARTTSDMGDHAFENSARLKESLDIAHSGIRTHDHAGRITWSDESCRIYGVSPKPFTPTGETFINLIHPDDRPAMQVWIDDCMASRKPAEFVLGTVPYGGYARYIGYRDELIRALLIGGRVDSERSSTG